MEPMHACHSSLLRRPIFEFHCVAAGVVNVFLNLLGAPLIIIPYGASIYPFMQLYSQGPAHQSAFPKGRKASLHFVSWSVPTLFWEPTGSVWANFSAQRGSLALVLLGHWVRPLRSDRRKLHNYRSAASKG